MKTKSVSLRTSEDENVTLGNEKIDQLDSFTYLGRIVSKDGGCREDFKSRKRQGLGCFSQLKKVWKSKMISLGTKIIVLEASDASGQIWF